MSAQYPDPCPETGRRVVTVADVGLDPWRLVEGIDAHTNGREYDVDFANGTFKTVTGEQPIYVRPQHYEALKCAASSFGS